MSVAPWGWFLTVAGILVVIAADLFLIHRNDTREFTTRRATGKPLTEPLREITVAGGGAGAVAEDTTGDAPEEAAEGSSPARKN